MLNYHNKCKIGLTCEQKTSRLEQNNHIMIRLLPNTSCLIYKIWKFQVTVSNTTKKTFPKIFKFKHNSRELHDIATSSCLVHNNYFCHQICSWNSVGIPITLDDPPPILLFELIPTHTQAIALLSCLHWASHQFTSLHADINQS